MKQRTIKEAFSIQGKGLHTGLKSTITFRPAPVDFGYKIKRTDLEEKPVITASAENVIHSQRCTLLSVDGVQVATIEHALAALYGCEIDNCLIEIDSPEFPILDGSAAEYVKNIHRVGIEEQSKERIYYEVDHEIEYFDAETGSFLRLLPSDSFSVHVQIGFDSDVLPVQNASLENLSDFEKELSMCRTFVFIKEIESLLKTGLIKGGDLDNAIVIYDQLIPQQELDRLADVMGIERKQVDKLGYIMNKPLLFPNEPARHKLLDVLGDISLVGKFMKGTIIANRPGHRVNNLFARNIIEHMQMKPVLEMVEVV
ncbi:UDP-3-O-acyl-N-acetylglucosamine deacetylase [Proteiniphilum sp.]|jgi:UDP-3-O-[3-hydroxymyristoyl] N-acetylglucosamine deacetylase/3-hydroxyacyl-[acyl-carrier-protein] dehydratase|uniref:UDP-3-O-acyl-N-acetylglucosamine deacetylase n=1 Tax=Proteiniphilum sp. TaxID=1926877 RepID=UPI002B1F04C7|nr:UDP-3-O-acyl-N-acetylglucosamine deacetylase [Proteiniphilum sp.]MEA5126568.1 UDP-3-O-acyl-N-acetylglucosamine deacetylase [Proteiniphilum sp.]